MKIIRQGALLSIGFEHDSYHRKTRVDFHRLGSSVQYVPTSNSLDSVYRYARDHMAYDYTVVHEGGIQHYCVLQQA